MCGCVGVCVCVAVCVQECVRVLFDIFDLPTVFRCGVVSPKNTCAKDLPMNCVVSLCKCVL